MKSTLIIRRRTSRGGVGGTGFTITLFETSFNETTDEATFATTSLGTLYWATHLTTETVTADGFGGFSGNTLETGSEEIVDITDVYPIPYTATTGTTGQTRRVSYYIRENGVDSNLITETFVIN